MKMRFLLLTATLVVVVAAIIVIAIVATAATTATFASISADVAAAVVAAGRDPHLMRAICASTTAFCHTAVSRSCRSLCIGFRQKSPVDLAITIAAFLSPRESPQLYLTALDHSDRALAITVAASCNNADPLITAVFDMSNRCRLEQLKMMTTRVIIS
jgi:hypothetical protein